MYSIATLDLTDINYPGHSYLGLRTTIPMRGCYQYDFFSDTLQCGGFMPTSQDPSSFVIPGVAGAFFRGANRTNFQPRIFIRTITHPFLTHPNLDALLYTCTNGRWKLNVV